MGDNVLIAAQAKAGKTTMLMNVVRAFVDGEPFLGRFDPPSPLDGRVVIVDAEMTRPRYARWARRINVARTDRVKTYFLRGQTHLFTITDPVTREIWAKQLRADEAEVLIVDPAAPLLVASGLDENSNPDVVVWLDALDTLKAEAGVDIMVVAHHTGHEGTRARGASRWRDWPDSPWTISFDEITGQRSFRAYGRDVDVPPTMLTLDPETLLLSLGEPGTAGGKEGKSAAKDRELDQKVLAVITKHPGMRKNEIHLAVGGRKTTAYEAADRLVELGLLERRLGPKGAQMHYLSE